MLRKSAASAAFLFANTSYRARASAHGKKSAVLQGRRKVRDSENSTGD